MTEATYGQLQDFMRLIHDSQASLHATMDLMDVVASPSLVYESLGEAKELAEEARALQERCLLDTDCAAMLEELEELIRHLEEVSVLWEAAYKQSVIGDA